MKLKKQTDPYPFTNESMGDYIYNSIIKDVNDIKSQVIDIVCQNKHTALKKPQVFLNKVNDFLKFWHEYGKRAAEAVDTNGVLANPTTNLKYNYVRKFLFGNFDFKSVLLYVDGMVKHISDEKKSYTQEDLEEFYKFTIKDAYGTDNVDISSLLTDFEVSGEMETPDEEPDFDINMLQGFEVFKDNDYTDLYKSIEGIIDFISFDRMKNLFLLKKQIKNNLLASFAVKSIFDYIIFSLTFYAIRIYTVAKFLNNFVNNDSEKNDSFTEAVITPEDGLDEFLKKMVIFKLDIESAYWYEDAIFASMDELIARDLDKTSFYKMFKMFADAHGISNLKTETIDRKHFISEFTKPFMESKLFNFFVENDFKNPSFNPNLTELYLKLKYLLNTPNQALATSENPVHNHRVRFLDFFIKMACANKNSLAELKHSSAVVYHFTKFMFEEILTPALDWINHCHCREIKPSDFTTDRKMYSIMNNFVSAFYDEFSLIVLKVMQYIENKIYYYEDGQHHDDKTSKPSPGYVRAVTRFDQVFIDGQQTFNESYVNVWSYPYYENMKLYNDYLKSYPEFSSLSYFNEGVAEWWDKIVAWFKGIFDKIMLFFQNSKVKRCIEWVKNNRTNIQNAIWKDDTEISVDWYRYKKSISLEDIKITTSNLKPFQNNEVSNAEKFDENKAKAEEAKFWGAFFDKHGDANPKFDKTKIVDLAKEKSAALKAAIINKVFFEIPPDKMPPDLNSNDYVTKLEEAQKTKIKGKDNIKKYIDIALGNLNSETFDTATNIVKESSEALKNKIKEVKDEIVKESVELYLQEEEVPSIAGDGQQSQKEKEEAARKNKSEILPYFQAALNRILTCYIIPVQMHLPKFFINQYNFVKAAYDARSNKE